MTGFYFPSIRNWEGEQERGRNRPSGEAVIEITCSLHLAGDVKLTFLLEGYFFMGSSDILFITGDHLAAVLWKMENASLFLLVSRFFLRPFASNNT